jgi:hypothetical protein
MNRFKDFCTRYNFVLLAAISAFLSAASGLFAESVGTLLGTRFAALLPHLLADGFIIFLAAELVERTLVTNLNRQADKRLAALGDEVGEVLRSSLNDAKYAEHYHVHFLPPRRSRRNEGVSYKAIAEAIENAKWIKLFCTSGRDIFSDTHIVRESLRIRAAKPPYLTVTVLSCEPKEDGTGGTYAMARSILEESNVSFDVSVALAEFKTLPKVSKNQKLALRWLYYDFVPQGWFLLTDRTGFAEFYHFGRGILNRGAPSLCMGGRVPLMSFSPSAGIYEALDEYLSYLAGDIPAENDKARDLRRDFFKIREIYRAPGFP